MLLIETRKEYKLFQLVRTNLDTAVAVLDTKEVKMVVISLVCSEA